MTYDYYKEKIKEIKKLISIKKFKLAYEEVLKETKMPYIPLKYEPIFQSFEMELSNILNDNSSSKVITIEKALDMLYGNEINQALALRVLPNYNLNSYKNEIKKIIEKWDNIYKKAVLYEILAGQEIDILISIKNTKINPSVFSILKNKETQKAFKKLELLSFKKPHCLDATFNQLHKYLLITFPNVLSSGEEIAIAIFNIVEFMFGENKKLNEKEQKIMKIISTQK